MGMVEVNTSRNELSSRRTKHSEGKGDLELYREVHPYVCRPITTCLWSMMPASGQLLTDKTVIFYHMDLIGGIIYTGKCLSKATLLS
jgi:hypothetical protein